MGGQQGAVAIVRLSGNSAVKIVGRLFRTAKTMRNKENSHLNNEWNPKSHRVQYGNLIDASGTLVDEVCKLVELFPKPVCGRDFCF